MQPISEARNTHLMNYLINIFSKVTKTGIPLDTTVSGRHSVWGNCYLELAETLNIEHIINTTKHVDNQN